MILNPRFFPNLRIYQLNHQDHSYINSYTILLLLGNLLAGPCDHDNVLAVPLRRVLILDSSWVNVPEQKQQNMYVLWIFKLSMSKLVLFPQFVGTLKYFEMWRCKPKLTLLELIFESSLKRITLIPSKKMRKKGGQTWFTRVHHFEKI